MPKHEPRLPPGPLMLVEGGMCGSALARAHFHIIRSNVCVAISPVLPSAQTKRGTDPAGYDVTSQASSWKRVRSDRIACRQVNTSLEVARSPRLPSVCCSDYATILPKSTRHSEQRRRRLLLSWRTKTRIPPCEPCRCHIPCLARLHNYRRCCLRDFG